MSEREPMRDKMQRNRPTLAGAVTGLVAALGAWGISAVATHVPPDVTAALHAAVFVGAGVLGSAAGKWAQQHTWAEDSHIEALEEAHQPDQLPQTRVSEPNVAAPEGV